MPLESVLGLKKRAEVLGLADIGVGNVQRRAIRILVFILGEA